MSLNIATFSNQSGGNAFYKAVGHPLAAAKAAELLATLGQNGAVAIYDPHNQLAGFAEFYPLTGIEIAGIFVQDVERIGQEVLGQRAQPITALSACACRTLLVASFDAARSIAQAKHVFPAGIDCYSFESLRLPDAMLTEPQRYLSTLNFATNLAFFRDADGQHTRLVTANYWGNYGARAVRLWCHLFAADGTALATWEELAPGANGSIVIDSAMVRARFQLPAFTGQLFVHVIGAAGHDVVKYALDTYGDTPEVLSCTHDANAWPSELYAGLPAPTADETVVLWVQNSHPAAIPGNAIGLNIMGEAPVAWLAQPIAPFATARLDVASLLPAARWPQQLEIHAGKHIVRPRYEVTHRNGRARIAHPNVERSDLRLDPKLAELGSNISGGDSGILGKLHILPAPILPLAQFETIVLPTPMSTVQTHVPLAAILYDAQGTEIMRHAFGNLPRNHQVALTVNDLLGDAKLAGGYGHIELLYDFSVGTAVDGWLHALFRYRQRATGHMAETSFGSHVFNTLMTYQNEPQSYTGKAPGLSTRLFLRCGSGEQDTLCHLIYPASLPWHAHSATTLTLIDRNGQEIAQRSVQIPCHGSLLWRVSERFTAAERAAAGAAAYVLVRDTTCRLFGYHGLISADDAAFSLDHMFGF
jgi:hypothetical protein